MRIFLFQNWFQMTMFYLPMRNLTLVGSVISVYQKEQRPIGFPMSKELVTREKKIVGGTIECCNFSMSYGVSMNIAGGTHHAFHNRGEAFCMLNDQAVAANVLIHEITDVNKVLIIDLDVHQGNGTASIFNDQEKSIYFIISWKKIIILSEKKKVILI